MSPHIVRAAIVAATLLLAACAPEAEAPAPRFADRLLLNDYERDFGFAQAVKVDKTVYVSALLPVDATGKLIGPADMALQLEAVYANLARVLEVYGVGYNAVVRENLYTTDMDALLQVADIRFKYHHKDSLPAITWLEVRRLVDPGMMVALEATIELP